MLTYIVSRRFSTSLLEASSKLGIACLVGGQHDSRIDAAKGGSGAYSKGILVRVAYIYWCRVAENGRIVD